MSGVQFDDSNSSYSYTTMKTKQGMAQWLVSKGWVKSERDANSFLVIVSVLLLVLAVGIFMFGPQAEVKQFTQEELEQSIPPNGAINGI